MKTTPSKLRSRATFALLALLLGGCALGRPPKGSEEALSAEERAAIERIRGRVDGWVVWSSSRIGNHDIFVMKTDGSDKRRLTAGEHVDWFPRFDPAGKRIMFTRSKQGWVSEKDANVAGKWDLMVLPFPVGGTPTLLVENASWGTWIGPEQILFSRGRQVIKKDLSSGEEQVLADSSKMPALGGADLQNPHLSPDGNYLAITLRGAMRETGIFALATQSWVKTGAGCQINWFPSGERILWVNPSGNGGSETFSVPVRDGRPTQEFSYEQMRFIDIPGRRSHEYFPQLDRSGKWLVWAATQRGHDHDIADYEIYIWELSSPPAQATRLTFHSGNDRWPDIYIP